VGISEFPAVVHLLSGFWPRPHNDCLLDSRSRCISLNDDKSPTPSSPVPSPCNDHAGSGVAHTGGCMVTPAIQQHVESFSAFLSCVCVHFVGETT